MNIASHQALLGLGIAPEDIMDPSLFPVHYLVLTDGDNTEGFADPGYDYSGWDVGLGGWDSNPIGSPGTIIPEGVNVRVWVRHSFILESTAGVGLYYTVDDDIDVWINDVVEVSQNGPLSGEQFHTVTAGHLVVGLNSVAVRVTDTGNGRCRLFYRFEQ